MDTNTAWLVATVVSIAAYILIPLIAVTAIVTKGWEVSRTTYVANLFLRRWARLFIAAHVVVSCVLVVFFGTHWLIPHVIIAAILTTVVVTLTRDNTETGRGEETQKAENTYLTGLIYLVALLLVGMVAAMVNGEKAEDAKFTQPVTHYVDADNRKMEGETHAYPISNLRINPEGTTYRWVEKRSDGTLATRKVYKGSLNEPVEVTVKDDLPATDMEARVERRYEYALNPEEIAAGHKECISPISYEKADVALYGSCARNVTVKFVRAETIIHIPAGSAEKAVPVVAE